MIGPASKTIHEAIRNKTVLVFLMTRLLSHQGEHSYAYFAVRLADAVAFITAAKTHGEVYDLESFGKVLAAGPGDAPTESDRERMEREYGFSHKEAVVL
jgi:hypothetical protein